MVKKLCFGLVVAVVGLYGMQGQTQAAYPLVCSGLCLVSTTTVVPSANPVEVGAQVIFQATVTLSSASTPPPSPTPLPGPTGTVDFSDSSTVLCLGVQLDGKGTASCQTSSLVAGSHTIKATYSGDKVYATSSGTVVENVTATPSTFSLGSQTASPYPTSVYSGGSAGPIPTDNPAPGSFTPLPTSVAASTIPYQPTLSPSSTAPGSGSNLLAIVVIIVVVLLIISAGAITLLLVVK